MTENSEEYWNDLLDQYKTGRISEEGRYELEKRALDDPFLFDALEGFSTVMGSGTEPKVAKTKILTLPRIAAAASLVFLCAMMFLLRDNKSEATDLETDKITMVISENQESEKNNDPSSQAETEELEAEEVAETRDESEPIGQKIGDKNAPLERLSENAKPAKTNEKKLVQKDKSEPKMRVPQQAENIQVIEQPVVYDDVAKDKNTNDTNVPDAQKGMDKLARANSAVEVEAGVESDLEIVQVADSEGAVWDSQYQTKKKSKATFPAYFVAIPELGKENFDNYASDLIKKRGLVQSPSKNIVIEFTIDQFGMPTDFTHIISDSDDCPDCGAFAVSILQRSGVWKTQDNSTNVRARYTFKF